MRRGARHRDRRPREAPYAWWDLPVVLGTLGVIEVALNALEIPHGKGGTEAAIEYLGESVSA